MNVFYPRLLDGNLNVLRRIEPVRGSLDMELEPLSSAELELQPGDSIPERSWVAVFTAYGLAGIFRSKPQRDRYGERSTTVSLVHGATELNDYLTGKTDEDVQSAANTAIQTIFSSYHGSLWTLGTVSPTASVVYGLNNSGVLDALVDLMEQLPGYMVTFDQTVTPWTVNIVPRPSEVTAEGRLSRNIQSVEISRDDSFLCTKVYYGENNSYVQDTTAVQKYGVIEHRISESGYTDIQLAAMAQAYLDSHKAPKLSVSISAIDLSQITGEPLDQIALGSKYRLVIPDAETEENRVIEQIVCSVRYDDFLTNPNPQITLASDPESIITFLKQQRRSGGAGRAVKQLEEKVNNQYQHWTTENEVYKESVYKILGVELNPDGTVKYVQAKDAQGNPIYDEQGNPVWETDSAGNPVPVYNEDSEGSLGGSVKQTAQDLTSLYTKTGVASLPAGVTNLFSYTSNIKQTAESIQTEVTAARGTSSSLGDRVSTMSSKIDQQANQISLVVTSTTQDGQTTNSINTAGIIVAINGGGQGVSSTTISADKIDLDGIVTAQQFETALASIQNLAGPLEVTGDVTVGGTMYAGAIEAESLGDYKVDGEPIGLGGLIKNITLTGPDSNDMYTLSAETLDGTPITIGNFSRAASQGETTVLNGVWGGSTYTVTAAPQGETWTINFDTQTTSDATWATELGTGTVNANNNKWLDFPLYIGSHNPSGQMTRSVTINKSINASAIYSEGQKDVTPTINPAGWRWHEVSGDTVLDNTVTAKNPYNASNDQSTTVTLPTLSVSVTNNQVIVNASDGTVSGVVATASHTKYADGQASVVPTFAAFTGTPGSTAQELSPGTYEFKVTKDGSITTDEFYTVPTAPTPPDPKISRDGTWSSGSLKFKAGTTGSDNLTVKIKSGAQTPNLTMTGTEITGISFDVMEDDGTTAGADTGADITAAINKTPATLQIGTFDSTNSKFVVSKASGGSINIGSSNAIQIGITALDIPVTPGTATPTRMEWLKESAQYRVTAGGSFTVGGQTVNQVAGQVTYSATNAINHGKDLAGKELAITSTNKAGYDGYPNITPTDILSAQYYLVKIGSTVYKKFQAPSGGSGSSDRTATYLEKITLTAPQNPEQDFNWTFDVGSIAHYENPTSVGTVNTNVQIDASAIYQAGIAAASVSGTVDVNKSEWTTVNGASTCFFMPSKGTGQGSSVSITADVTSYQTVYEAGSTANVKIKDRDEVLQEKTFWLRKISTADKSYVVLTNTMSLVPRDYMAKYEIEDGGGEQTEQYTVTSIDPITLTASDISSSVTKYPVLRYNDPSQSTDNTVPLQIDASAVYSKGLTDGSRLNIEKLRTITQPLTQNTTYTFKPSDYNDVMRAITFDVEVPIGIDSASILRVNDNSGTYSGWDGKAEELSHKYCQIEVVPNSGENYYLKIDASKLYDKGVAYGASSAGYQLTTVTLQGTKNTFRQINVPTGTDTVRAVSGAGTIYRVDSNGSVYLRGGGVSKAGEGKIFYRNTNGAYVFLGEGKCFITDENVTTLYKSSTTRLAPVAASTYTVATGSKSAYVTDSKGTIEFYTKGRTVSDTYYIKTT